MKKVLFRSMMVAVCTMMMATVMTSCNEGTNTPDDPQKPQQDTTKVDPVDSVAVAAFMNFEFSANAKMLEVFDINIEYYDENSELKTEAYKGGDVVKTITTKGLPAKTGVRFTVEKKIDLDTMVVKQFESEYFLSYESYAVNKDGKRANAWSFQGGRNGEHVQHPISLLERYLASMAKVVAKVYEFDAKGEPTEKNWEDKQ